MHVEFVRDRHVHELDGIRDPPTLDLESHFPYMSGSVRSISLRGDFASRRKKMSERTFNSLSLPGFPFAVFHPFVDILATMVPSALTALKSNTPPELRSTRSREKRWPYRSDIHSRRTHSSTTT